MAFTTILSGIAISYVVYYASIIIYDLYISDKGKQQLSEDEEIEISADENALSLSSYALGMSSATVSSDASSEVFAAQEDTEISQFTDHEYSPSSDSNNDVATMNGGLSIDDLCQQVRNESLPDALQFIALRYESKTEG